MNHALRLFAAVPVGLAVGEGAARVADRGGAARFCPDRCGEHRSCAQGTCADGVGVPRCI